MLQNQIEQFGDHMFKEGSIVIPGGVSYNSRYQCIELQNDFLELMYLLIFLLLLELQLEEKLQESNL